VNFQPVIFASSVERIEDELYLEQLDYPSFHTKALYEGAVIRLNITVLPCSNATVAFEYGYPNTTYWVPEPPNFTLSPGETTGVQNYTLESYMADYHGLIIYDCYIINEGPNATVYWWYEILEEGSYVPAAGTLITIGALFITAVIVQKKRKKGD
jgi:hypothetical protein